MYNGWWRASTDVQLLPSLPAMKFNFCPSPPALCSTVISAAYLVSNGWLLLRDNGCLPCLPHIQRLPLLPAWCSMVDGALLHSLSGVVGADSSLPYGELYDELVGGMFDLHWDGEEEAFFDHGVHTADGEVIDQVIMRCQNGASCHRRAFLSVIYCGGGYDDDTTYDIILYNIILYSMYLVCVWYLVCFFFEFFLRSCVCLRPPLGWGGGCVFRQRNTHGRWRDYRRGHHALQERYFLSSYHQGSFFLPFFRKYSVNILVRHESVFLFLRSCVYYLRACSFFRGIM